MPHELLTDEVRRRFSDAAVVAVEAYDPRAFEEASS